MNPIVVALCLSLVVLPIAAKAADENLVCIKPEHIDQMNRERQLLVRRINEQAILIERLNAKQNPASPTARKKDVQG